MARTGDIVRSSYGQDTVGGNSLGEEFCHGPSFLFGFSGGYWYDFVRLGDDISMEMSSIGFKAVEAVAKAKTVGELDLAYLVLKKAYPIIRGQLEIMDILQGKG